jgi:DNA repair photolyase
LASLNLIAYSKGFSDREIEEILRACAETYLKQVYEFCKTQNDEFALTLKNTTGKIKKLLNETRIKSHVNHLDTMTVIENYDRKFIRSKTIKEVEEPLRTDLFTVSY